MPTISTKSNEGVLVITSNDGQLGSASIVVFQWLGAGGNIGLRITQNREFGGGQGVFECFCRSDGESHWRWDFVCRGWGAQVSEDRMGR